MEAKKLAARAKQVVLGVAARGGFDAPSGRRVKGCLRAKGGGMSENKTVILKDESGAEIKVKDFESLLSEHHLQMRMSYDTDPDSPIQRAAIQRNFVGVGHLPRFFLNCSRPMRLVCRLEIR